MPVTQKQDGNHANVVFASGRQNTPVTPSDSTNVVFDALYIGGDGNVVVSNDGGVTTTTYVGLQAGQTLPVSGNRVMLATTATNIVALNI